MILIQVILVIAIMLAIIRFIGLRDSLQTQAWEKILLLFFAVGAIIFILFPNLLNKIANFVGVGRGADLLLYVLTITFIYVQISNYIKSKEENIKIVKLTRKIAISEALRRKEVGNK